MNRWTSLEFIVYYIIVSFAIVSSAFISWNMSDLSTSYYYKYKGRLSTGWLFNRPVDNSDKQYAGFRNNLMALTLLFTLFSL
ncbi:hypothetical protein ROZALSC1DRAFT_16484, partial [Rozella allomycis CSF55]